MLLTLLTILTLVLSVMAVARPVIAHEGGQDVPLANGTSEGTPADGDKEIACSDEELLALQPGEAIFHFVLVGLDAGTALDAFEASFDTTGDTTADVTYTLASPNVSFEERSSGNYSINVIVDADAVLIDATAHISPTQADPTKPKLNLSHTCIEGGDVDGSLVILKTDDNVNSPTPLSATFQVTGPNDYDETFTTDATTGKVCIDGLAAGDYTITETVPPAGYDPADPTSQPFTVVVDDGCDSRGDEVDVTFRNTLTDVDGSLTILKTDDLEPATPLMATFQVTGPDAYDETVTTDATTGMVCIDGLAPGEYTITETVPPAGYDPADPAFQTFAVVVDDGCGSDDGAVDVTFENTLTEEELGSITVVKEVDCEDCETRTIGYYFNTADQHEEETNALFDDLGGIMADGILFTNVDQVQQYRADDQDGTSDGQNGLSAVGQLTLQYLAATLNVARNGEDCDLANRVYNNADSPFDGWTVQQILDAADAAFGGDDTYAIEDIKSALDDINNSSHEEENPLSCEGAENGTLDGVTFDLFLEEDYPDGDPIDSQTTSGGQVVFADLELDVTYVLVESGFPDAVTCEIVDVIGEEGVAFTLNDDGSVTIELTANDPDITLTVVNDCEEEQEEELGSILIAKTDDAEEPALLGGATFEVGGIEYVDDDEDGFVCVDGLTLGDTVSVEETVAPDGYIGEEGAIDVVVLSTDDCETRLAGEDPQADADITFVNVLEDEEEGDLEVIKLFCPTAGDDAIFVFGPLVEEPVDLRTLGQEGGELPDDEGCTLGAPSEEALGATFTITGGDLTEPLVVHTTWDEILTVGLAPGTYEIVEEGTGLSATFEIVADGDTAVVVFNFLSEEGDEGNLKILKFFCEGDSDVVFTIADGDAGLADVELPADCQNPTPGDADFTLNDGENDSAVFDLGTDGARLIPLTAGTYTLTEVAPNEATSGEFAVTAGETTTVIVFDFAGGGEGGESPGGHGPGGEGTLGGNPPVPNTAMDLGATGTVPAALLALLMLSGLGAAGYAARAEARRRR